MGRRALVVAIATLGLMLGISVFPASSPAASAAVAVMRIAGADRYGTAVAVSHAAFPSPIPHGTVVLASGVSDTDEFAAGPMAFMLGGPGAVSTATVGRLAALRCAGSALRAYASAHAVTSVTAIEGPTRLRGLVARLTPCLSTAAASSVWVMVDKKHHLSPSTYRPSDLRAVALPGHYPMRRAAASALERLSAASHGAGHGTLGVASAFRSYSYQQSLHAHYADAKGRKWADLASARPGYSEHQTGLAADVIACTPGCGSMDGFGSSSTGRWVAANAWRYGFIVRYEAGRTSITGYAAEPWHLRYVGAALAADYHAGGFHTLEQYLGYSPAPTY